MSSDVVDGRGDLSCDKFILVAEKHQVHIGSGAEILGIGNWAKLLSMLNWVPQRTLWRFSAMADRREEEHVPQFHGRIDEIFAEWVIDVKLWEAEYKEEDRDRLGPKLYRRGLHGQPKIIVKTMLGTQDVPQFTVDNIIQCLQDNGYEELPEELGQEALDNYFDMRQGKAESIQDYIFREEILTVRSVGNYGRACVGPASEAARN